MTLAELAKETGYRETTIKFLLREKLLKPGAKISERLSDYGANHIARLDLIRALHDKIGIPYQDILPITTALDKQDVQVYAVLGLVQSLLMPKHTPSKNTRHFEQLLVENHLRPAHPSYIQNFAGTIEEAATNGIAFNDKTLSTMIDATKQIVELEMNSELPQLNHPDKIIRYSALGMFYTSSVITQLMRMTEQTLAKQMTTNVNREKAAI